MSRVYDNWERLVAAVLKREDFRQLALCESFSSSIADDSSSRFSFDFSFEDVDVSESEEEAGIDRGGGSQVQNGGDWKEDEWKEENGRAPRGERRRSRPNPRLSNPPKHIHGEQVAAGWPSWLSIVAGEAINGWTPRFAHSFEKIDKIGGSTYSIVYKARDSITGNIVALKKVRFDNLEPESVRLMAREILILRRLDHPNVLKLQGIVISRMSSCLYLVFDYMDHDLAGLASTPGIKFTLPQVKCYMHQLFSGLEHCHNRHVLHRGIKGSDLLVDDGGVLKIADFGTASFFDPNNEQPMTSRVISLWYRPWELLLGATYYGVGVDLWSAGCILAELLAGKPIMPGRTEVEQLHKIYKLCGSPTEEHWKKSKLPHATIFKPIQPYTRCIKEAFKDFPQSSISLIDTLLAIDPSERQTATAALKSEFFTTKPYACNPSSLPKYPPSKEIHAKRRDEEARRLRAAGKTQTDGVKKTRTRDRRMRAVPAPEANAELQKNIDRRRLINHASAKSKSEKFPPPHQDGGLGYPLRSSHHMDPAIHPPDILLRTAGITQADDVKKTLTHDRRIPAVPAPEANSEPLFLINEANSELQMNINRRRQFTYVNEKSKSEKFPPPNQDDRLAYPLGSSHHLDPATYYRSHLSLASNSLQTYVSHTVEGLMRVLPEESGLRSEMDPAKSREGWIPHATSELLLGGQKERKDGPFVDCGRMDHTL